MPPPTPNQWSQLRPAIHQAATATLRVPDLRLTDINAAALSAAEPWGALGRAVDWSWRALARRSTYQVRTAIWHGNRLCGLMCGSAGEAAVVLRYLEGAPGPAHPLKGRVADIGVATAEVYAQAIGAPALLLNDPIQALVTRFSTRPGYGWMTEPSFRGYFGRKVMP